MTKRVTDGRSGEALAVQKASGMLVHAQALLAAGRSAEAVSELNKLVHLQLPATREAEKLMAESYRALGDVYRNEASGVPKAIQFYNRAIQHMSPTLDSAAFTGTQALIAQLSSNTTAAVRLQVGGAPPSAAPLDAGDDNCGEAVPVSITSPHHEVMSINPSGDHNWRSYTTTTPSIVRIETNSDDIFGDDTTLALYGSCSGTTAGDFITFDDDGGPGFLSFIETACMPAGTYFVDVGGFDNTATPSDFDLIITHRGSCVVPSPDQYEPDNELASAKKIGYRNNGVGEGNQHGRNNNNIQHHTIFNVGDIDFVKFSLSRANFVRMETSGADEPDTVIGVSLADGTLIAVNDDQAPDNFTSKLQFCLPSGDWRGVVVPFNGSATFPYDLAVDVEHPCNFESEPNGSFASANTIQTGKTISGLHTFAPVGDNDFFKFTLTSPQQVLLETSGYDIFDVDTTLDLYDSSGNLLDSDEDGGDGFLSRLNDLLPAGTYYVNVWSFFAGYYFPYDLTLSITEPPDHESEPNDTCNAGNVVGIGDTVEASISPAGDIDSYHLVVPSDGFVEIETSGSSGDTVLTITSLDGSTAIGCDDDNGDGFFSLWGCCLPAGEYCVQVQEFSPSATIPAYTIEFRGTGACTPSDPLVCPNTGLACE
ncbi:MAG TPA: hypothetical protein VJ826_14465 [Candidatus Polarisedimenticolaceae bacterium]|nr:hypothetical protein [Candidatus Polarisedimenticolaceae bacterium]